MRKFPPKKDMIVDKLKQTFEVSTNYLLVPLSTKMTVYVVYVTTKLSQITRFVISVPHSRSHTVVEGKYLLLGRGNIYFLRLLFCFS